jgi:hypothetical protein
MIGASAHGNAIIRRAAHALKWELEQRRLTKLRSGEHLQIKSEDMVTRFAPDINETSGIKCRLNSR